MTAGRFITFEGGEGSGKSTHATRLRDALAARGHEVVLTREPGGAPNAERVRALLLEAGPGPWDPLSEALLHFAARREHLAFTIRPALARGAVVVCDRYTDSTRAYQGYAQGVSLEVIDRLHALVAEGCEPDVTLILDLPAEQGLERAARRDGGPGTRYEAMEIGFHRALRQGFAAIAAREPGRCALIDARPDIDTVFARVLEIVDRRLGHGP